MTPLENDQRSQGGRNRAKNQDPEERKFQAMLAANRRPLLHDVKMTPEETLRTFKELQKSQRWLYLFIVGADRRTIRHTLPDNIVLRRLKEVGGAIGFMGLIMFGTRLQIYYKPLKRGVQVIEQLERVSREIMAVALENLREVALPDIEG
jgi:hypothetical protein